MTASDLASRQTVVTRTFAAPRELVFAAWTRPEHLERWWGPDGFSTKTHHFDFREGGSWQHTMRGPDGKEYPNHSTYVEIVVPERIVCDIGTSATDVHFRSTTTFTEQDGQTTVTMVGLFPTQEIRDFVVEKVRALEGGAQTLAKMQGYVAQLQASLQISRTFAAPATLVYDVWTQTEHLLRWWGPAGMQIGIARNEQFPGGIFHYNQTLPNGDVWWGKWQFLTLDRPNRIALLQSFSDAEGQTQRPPFAKVWPLLTLSIVTFRQEGENTVMEMLGVPLAETEEEREAFANMRMNMQQGWGGTLAQMEKYLMSL